MSMSNTEQFLRCETLCEIQRVLNNEETHTNFHVCSDDYDSNLERKLLLVQALMEKLNVDLKTHKAKKRKLKQDDTDSRK